jgi:CspA family cold shock protein
MDTKAMTFRDRWITDEDGHRFIFTVEMQRRLSHAGLPVEPAYLNELDKPVQREELPLPRRPEISEPSTIQIDPSTGKYVGRVKWYNSRKGYGFILRGANEEIFFHRSNTLGDPEQLREGQWILYDVEDTGKGPEATEVEGYEPPQEGEVNG